MNVSKQVNQEDLINNYKEASKDIKFKKLVKTIDVPDEVAMKYTSSLEDSICELNNCSKCSGLIYCKNRLEGHVYYPKKNDNRIIFSYVACKYQKELLEKEKNKISRDKDIFNAKMSDIYKDKERINVIKWLKKFYDTYDKNGNCKGLYLHGNFGCGKTYLISALFNELSKKRIITEIVYFPELFSEIKVDFDTYGDKI